MKSRANTNGLLVACALLLVACGGASLTELATKSSLPNAPQELQWPVRQVALDTTLAELEELPTPAGADATVFADRSAASLL